MGPSTSDISFGSLRVFFHYHGKQEREENDACDNAQREHGGDVHVTFLRQHLGANEDEHDGEAVLEKPEIIDGVGEDEIERAQPEDGKYVRRKNDERFLCHAKNCRNRIKGEDQIRRFHHEQHESERCKRTPAVQRCEKFRAFELFRNREKLSCELEHQIVFRFDPAFIRKKHFDAAENQKGSEHIKHPLETHDERGTRTDHESPHEQCTHDAPEEHAMLVFGRYFEIGEEQGDDKNIVDRKSVV